MRAPGTNEIEGRVETIMKRDLNVKIPTRDTDLIDTGLLDSLGFVQLISNIETEFDTRVDLQEVELDEFRTVSSIARFLSRRNI